MTLDDLKRVVDVAHARAGDLAGKCRVEVWIGKKGPYDVLDVGQFNLIPDVTITAGVKPEHSKMLKQADKGA